MTAGGVETQAELDAQHELGADHAQGYHLSRPLDRQALEALLQALPRH